MNNNIFTGDRRLTTARQLGAEHGVSVGTDDIAEAIVAQIMGCPVREVSEVRSHSHGLAVTMRDESGYIITLRSMPDADGRAGVLLAADPRYKMAIAVFAKRSSRPEPVEAEPKPKRRIRRERTAPPDPVAAAPADAWAADPVGVAQAELAEVEAALAACEADTGVRGVPDFNKLEALKRKAVLARARVREARAIVAAPGLAAEELELWVNAFLWARELCAAPSAYEAERTRRDWVQRWPTSGRLAAAMCSHELEAATSWLSEHAPDTLAKLLAEDVAVSA